MTLPETDIEDLFAGRVDSGRTDLEDLTAFFARLEASVVDVTGTTTEAEHLASMMAAASEPSSTPSITPISTPRRGSLRVRSVAALAAVLCAFSGMAVAGVLPGPIQRASARVADRIGIHLPGLLDKSEDGASDKDPGSKPAEVDVEGSEDPAPGTGGSGANDDDPTEGSEHGADPEQGERPAGDGEEVDRGDDRDQGDGDGDAGDGPESDRDAPDNDDEGSKGDPDDDNDNDGGDKKEDERDDDMNEDEIDLSDADDLEVEEEDE